MSRHPWKQIISDYHISGLTKGKFFSQYNQNYPEAKLCRTSFYNKLRLLEQALHAEEAALALRQILSSEETMPEHSSSREDSVNIVEVKPEPQEEIQKLSALPFPANSSKFDAIVVRVPGGITITLPTKNGLADLSILLNNLAQSLKSVTHLSVWKERRSL